MDISSHYALQSSIGQYLQFQNPLLNVVIMMLIGTFLSKLLPQLGSVIEKWWSRIISWAHTLPYSRSFKVEHLLERGGWEVCGRQIGCEHIIDTIICDLKNRFPDQFVYEEYLPKRTFEIELEDVELMDHKSSLLNNEKIGVFVPEGMIYTPTMNFEFDRTLDDKRTCKTHMLTISAKRQSVLDEYLVSIFKKIQQKLKDKYERTIYQLSPSTLLNKELTYFETTFESIRTMDSVFFTGKSRLCQYLDWFIQKEGPFGPKKLMRKLTILLHGPPGTGKSSVIRAVMNYMNEKGEQRDLRYIHLSNIPDDIFLTEVLHENRKNVISVIEDITEQGVTEILKPQYQRFSPKRICDDDDDDDDGGGNNGGGIGGGNNSNNGSGGGNNSNNGGNNGGNNSNNGSGGGIGSSNNCNNGGIGGIGCIGGIGGNNCNNGGVGGIGGGGNNGNRENFINSEMTNIDIGLKMKTDKISLSGFLNALDGSMELTNAIIIMTTNNKHKLNDALIRPGRITLELCLDRMDKQCLCDMLHYFYPEASNEDILHKLHFYHDGTLTPAEVERQILHAWGKDVNAVIEALMAECKITENAKIIEKKQVEQPANTRLEQNITISSPTLPPLPSITRQSLIELNNTPIGQEINSNISPIYPQAPVSDENPLFQTFDTSTPPNPFLTGSSDFEDFTPPPPPLLMEDINYGQIERSDRTGISFRNWSSTSQLIRRDHFEEEEELGVEELEQDGQVGSLSDLMEYSEHTNPNPTQILNNHPTITITHITEQ